MRSPPLTLRGPYRPRHRAACTSRYLSRPRVPRRRTAKPRRRAWPRPCRHRARGAGFDRSEQKVALFQPKPCPFRPLAAAVRSAANHTRKAFRRCQFALDPKWREGLVLTYRYRALAGHFKRGGKRRSLDRAANLGRRAKSRQIRVEHRPIERPPSESFEFATRVGERPDNPLLKSDSAKRLFLAPMGISGQQLIEARPPLRRASGERSLGVAPQKHVAAETRPVHERFGGGADRLEAAQPELQRFREVDALGLGVFCRLGKQKPRL